MNPEYYAYFHNLNDGVRVFDLKSLRLLTLFHGPVVGLHAPDDLMERIENLEALDRLFGVESPDYFEDFVDLQLWAWANLGVDLR